MDSQDLRYPIGTYEPKEFSPSEIAQNIDRIAALPAKFEQAVDGLNDVSRDTPYREGGWTVRQVVHHVSDSHMNAYIRTKWALTEDTPLIKAYEEKTWAVTPEMSGSVEMSLPLLRALHVRWVALLRGLGPEQLARAFLHPETGNLVTIAQLTGLYAWHGEHHLAHITSLMSRMK